MSDGLFAADHVMMASMHITTLVLLVLASAAAAKRKAPEDELAKEMTHDLEMNFNKIAPFGKCFLF